MSLRFLKNLFGTDARPRTRTTATRLNVESLEARDVPAMVNLTTAGSSGVLNGAIFQQINTPSSDTLQSFVRLGADGVEQGYNTDARPLQYDERRDPLVTRSLHKDSVPVVNIGGVNYLEFVLDINQTVANPRLSLDELRIFVGGTGNLSGYRPRTDTLGGMTAAYDMDAGTNNWVQLNANLNRGGTSGDMRLLVPEAAFAGGSYIYLYSKFGVNRSANGSYEQWSVRQAPTTLGSIGGVLFSDFNGNGIFNPEDGEELRQFTVWLDTNNNRVYDEGVDLTTTTDDAGFYTFSGLAAGNYVVGSFSQLGETLISESPLDVELAPGMMNATGVNFRFVQGGGG